MVKNYFLTIFIELNLAFVTLSMLRDLFYTDVKTCQTYSLGDFIIFYFS